jgi:hypothetical protein
MPQARGLDEELGIVTEGTIGARAAVGDQGGGGQRDGQGQPSHENPGGVPFSHAPSAK